MELFPSFPKISVVDPNPYVFGTLGSEFVIICTDPDPSINKQKVRKTLISTILWLFRSLKTDVNDLNVPSTRKEQKTLKKKITLVGTLSATDEKIRIRIRTKCDGSTTLKKMIPCKKPLGMVSH